MFKFINIPVIFVLVLQIIFGIFIYIGLAKLFKIESFGYLILTIKHILNSRKGR